MTVIDQFSKYLPESLYTGLYIRAWTNIEKAYDTVNRKIMWELVERLGFDEHKKDITKYVQKYNS